MILADTSVWVDHVRRRNPDLTDLLDAGEILTHSFVIAEVAMGNLPRRPTFLEAMDKLRRAATASDREAISLMERERLYGLGIGFVDLHLLASTRLTPSATLWTRDRRLREIARRLGVGDPRS
ncbi:MAG TPA: type II toxin-antitoxin system VapC family toxin [Caulobacteraceae bacterium]